MGFFSSIGNAIKSAAKKVGSAVSSVASKVKEAAVPTVLGAVQGFVSGGGIVGAVGGAIGGAASVIAPDVYNAVMQTGDESAVMPEVYVDVGTVPTVAVTSPPTATVGFTPAGVDAAAAGKALPAADTQVSVAVPSGDKVVYKTWDLNRDGKVSFGEHFQHLLSVLAPKYYNDKYLGYITV